MQLTASLKIHFLGTKGEIEERPKRHIRHSSFIVEYKDTKLQFDFGKGYTIKDVASIEPTAILITHAHPDHSFGLLNLSTEIPIYMSTITFNKLKRKRDFCPEDLNVKVFNKAFSIGLFKIKPFQTMHSTLAPSNGYIIYAGGKKIVYPADTAYMNKDILQDAWLYICDGSYLKSPTNIRRVGRVLTGHASVRQQLKWCQERDVRNVIVTHFGKWVIGQNLRSVFMQLSREFDMNVHAAHDNRKFHPKDTKFEKALTLPGRYLVEPHGNLIFKAKDPKTLIVSTVEDKKYVGKTVYVVEDQKVLGIIRITRVQGPYPAALVKYRLRERHKISDEEWKVWEKKYEGFKDKVYVTSFVIIKKFDKPVYYSPAPGTQRWISAVELPRQEVKAPPKAEVTPPEKVQREKNVVAIALDEDNVGGYTTAFDKAKFFMFFDKETFKFYFKPKTSVEAVNEVAARSKAVIAKEISNATKELLAQKNVKVYTYSGQAGKVLESANQIPIISEWSNNQLKTWLSQLNEKQLRHWFSKCFAWQRLVKQKKTKKLDMDELKRRFRFVLAEFRKRNYEIPELKLQSEIDLTMITIAENLAPISGSGEVTGREVTLKELLSYHNKPFYEKRPFITLTGGIVNRGKTKGDFDYIISHKERIDERDRPTEFRIFRMLPDDLQKRPTFHYGEFGGPFTSYIPLYDRICVPSSWRKVIKMEEMLEFFSYQIQLAELRDPKALKEAKEARSKDKIEPMQFVLPCKPMIGHEPGERYSLETVAALFKPEDYPLHVEKKYDGNLIVIMKEGDKVIFRTGAGGFDVTHRLQGSLAELKTWNHPHTVTLVSDSEKWIKGKYVGREIVAAYLHGKFKGTDEGIVHNIFDCVYFYDEEMEKHDVNCKIGDLHKEPFSVRRRYLDLCPFKESTMEAPKVKTYFNKAPSLIAKNVAELKKHIRTVSVAEASEGAVIKEALSKFPLTGANYEWAKFKKTADLHAIILKVLPTKTAGMYRYRVGLRIPAGWNVMKTDEIKGARYMDIGKTMVGKKVLGKLEEGTIVTVNYEELFYYIDPETQKRQLVVYVPQIISVREKQTIPDSAEEAIVTAKRTGLLIMKEERLSRLESEAQKARLKVRLSG